MMNWTRYIKRTAVRRVVWIVVGLIVYAILSAFGIVHAQEKNCGSQNPVQCDQGEAYAWTLAQGQKVVLGRPASPPCPAQYERTNLDGPFLIGGNGYHMTSQCVHVTTGAISSTNSHGRSYFYACPAGTEFREDLGQCAGPCDGLPNREFNRNTSIWGAPPGQACVSGCAYTQDASSTLCTLVEEGPTSGYWCNMIYRPTGGTCEVGEDIPPSDPNAPEAECSAGEVRLPNGQCSPRGQCPIGQHEVEGACHPVGNCPAYHVKAPDGSCTPVPCPSGQARGQDGTCKADGNSDGTPDEEGPGGDSDNKDGMTFSGGESCSVPPTCSGDPIMCGQARIQWRIDCNTRRAESVPGGDACDNFSMPICVGEACDPVEQKQLILQWRAMCALQDLVSQDGEGEGDGGTAEMNVEGVGIDAVDGASGTVGDGGDPSGAFTDGSEGGDGSGELDTSGFGWGTSCPQLPSINVLGTTLDFNEVGPRFCDWMSLGGQIVLILSALISLRILAGGMNV